jgi:prepilin-type processing-associated H-X9-DG protein
VSQYRDLLTANFDETLWKGGAGGTARGRNTTQFNTGQPSPAIVQDSPTVTHGNRWGSPHPGNCNFVLVDGSIRGVKYGADPMPAMLPNDDRLLDTD